MNEETKINRDTYRELRHLRSSTDDLRIDLKCWQINFDKNARGKAYAVLASYLLLEKFAITDAITAFFKYWIIKG